MVQNAKPRTASAKTRLKTASKSYILAQSRQSVRGIVPHKTFSKLTYYHAGYLTGTQRLTVQQLTEGSKVGLIYAYMVMFGLCSLIYVIYLAVRQEATARTIQYRARPRSLSLAGQVAIMVRLTSQLSLLSLLPVLTPPMKGLRSFVSRCNHMRY